MKCREELVEQFSLALSAAHIAGLERHNKEIANPIVDILARKLLHTLMNVVWFQMAIQHREEGDMPIAHTVFCVDIGTVHTCLFQGMIHCLHKCHVVFIR